MILSFVIPVYNCEKYIYRCLEQICASEVEFDNYEIVVINDGSHDGSDAEIKRFRDKYTTCNINYIVKENQGASAARNRGIEEAKGDFIWFVDADDLINSSFFSTIIKRQKDYHEDLICFNYAIISGDETKETNEFKDEICLSGVDYLSRGPYNYVWNKIFRRSSIGSHRFLHGIKNTEDWLFIMTSVVNMQSVICIPEIGYYYNTNNTGSTLRNRTIDNLKKNYADTQLVHKTLLNYIHQQKDVMAIRVLKKALNYSVIGFFYAMFIDKMPFYYVKNVIKNYESLHLYPAITTSNHKANIFLKLLNIKSVFLVFVYIRQKTHVV